MAKLTRVIIYEGEQEHLLKTILSSGVPMNGSFNTVTMKITSQVVEAQNFPCLKCSKETSNLSLVCDECEKEIQLAKQRLNRS